jgi:hypothetical protein
MLPVSLLLSLLLASLLLLYSLSLELLLAPYCCCHSVFSSGTVLGSLAVLLASLLFLPCAVSGTAPGVPAFVCTVACLPAAAGIPGVLVFIADFPAIAGIPVVLLFPLSLLAPLLMLLQASLL